MIKHNFRWLFWLFVFNILLAFCISSLYLRASALPDNISTLLFLGFSAIAHYTAIALIPFLLIYGCVLYLKREPVLLNVFLVLIFSAAQLLLFVDVIVYGLHRFHLNGMVWNLLSSGVALDVLSIPRMTWISSALVVSAIVLAQIFALIVMRCYERKLPKTNLLATLLVLIVLSTHVTYAWADFVQYAPVTRYARLLPAFRPLTAKGFLSSLGLKQASTSPSWSPATGSCLRYPHGKLQCEPCGKRKNILMVVIDSWRFDAMNQNTTPNIADFATKSWIFENHFSAGNTTRFGFFSLMYGVYGTYWRDFLTDQKGPVLLDQIKKEGYEIGVFASAPLTNPEFDRTVFVNLLDVVRLKQEGASPVERDDVITDKMVSFLENHDRTKPFFGLLFYDAAHAKQFPPEFARHTPYAENINYITLGPGTDPEPIRNAYLNALAFVDTKIGSILEMLTNRGLLQDTVVVITGDHGEEFNDLGMNYWGHNSNFGQYQVRTPLLVRVPGQLPHRFSHHTSHLDVVPTLMQTVFGCTTPPSSYSNGVPLTNIDDRSFMHVSSWDAFALVEWDRIFVFENNGSTTSLDAHYQEVEEEKWAPKSSLIALEGMSRFYLRNENAEGKME